jgi:hypothetical protein
MEAVSASEEQEVITLEEAVALGASDGVFYSHFFFPRTVRQKGAKFHEDMWATLDSDDRLNSFMVFRGGAKTTLLRIFISKRVAYAVSRTIIVVCKSQDNARRTVEWLMKQVLYNRSWAETFQLRQGNKWTGEEIEIYHGVDEVPIRVIALGITGSTRGINVDDYRPDLIVVDDPCDEENTATQEQRDKTEDLILGSLLNSLSPPSEAPLGMMVLLQTLLNDGDVISKCDKDPAWNSVRIPIFTSTGQSAWPARWSTEELLEQKQSFIDRGKLSLWMREMECKLVSGEMSAFRATELLQYWDILPPEEEITVVVTCDPVPPPSEREIKDGLRGKDYEAWSAVGIWQDRARGVRKLFVLETRLMRGHDPDWSVKTFFEMLDRWHPIKVKVESVAYQRTLKWLLEKAMMRKGRFVMIDAHVPEKRKKSYRIIDGIGAVLGRRELYVHRSQSSLIEAIHSYPHVAHDDEIEAVSVGLTELMQFDGAGGTVYDIADAEKDIPALEFDGGCP